MSTSDFNTNNLNWKVYASNIQTNVGQNLTLDASGNSSLFVKTNGTTRLTISGTGLTTFGTLGSYDPSTNFFTATKFVGDLSGNATNVYVDNSSLSNITYYPTFASTYNSNILLKADTDYTYNPSTNILSAPTVNVTSEFQKGGTGVISMRSVDFGVAMTTGYDEYYVTLPSPVDIYNFVNIRPYAGANDIVYLYGYALGFWSGVQNPNQIRIICRLGNAVASNIGTFRVYYIV